MQLLSVSAGFYRIHHDIFRGHEGQLGHKAFLDNLRIYHQAVHHVQHQIQNAVHGQKAFRNGQPLIGRIIQCSLKPLSRRCDGRIQRVDHHIPGQGRDALAPHGIPFVGHSRRTDLALLKGLLNLLQVLQQPDIVGELMCAGGNACQHVGHSGVHLPGIGLP